MTFKVLTSLIHFLPFPNGANHVISSALKKQPGKHRKRALTPFPPPSLSAPTRTLIRLYPQAGHWLTYIMSPSMEKTTDRTSGTPRCFQKKWGFTDRSTADAFLAKKNDTKRKIKSQMTNNKFQIKQTSLFNLKFVIWCLESGI